MWRFAFVLCTALLSFTVAAFSQTTLNPDISLVGDVESYIHNDPLRADEQQKLKLADPALEMFVTGYLNPYVRASGTVSWHSGGNAEVEEIYATVVRGLPLRSSITAGKHLLPFGRLNPVHEHAWSFVMRPLPHELFFGDEGLNDMAVRVSFSLPTGSAYTELMGAVLKGEALLGHEHAESSEVAPEIDPNLGGFARLTTSMAVSEHAELALGASIVNAVHDIHQEDPAAPIHQLRATIAGVDAKYKLKPSRYSTLQIEGEGLFRRSDAENGDHLNSYGGYGYLDYRFRQVYNLGGIFEYAKVKEMSEDNAAESDVIESRVWRAGLFIGRGNIRGSPGRPLDRTRREQGILGTDASVDIQPGTASGS